MLKHLLFLSLSLVLILLTGCNDTPLETPPQHEDTNLGTETRGIYNVIIPNSERKDLLTLKGKLKIEYQLTGTHNISKIEFILKDYNTGIATSLKTIG